MGTLFMGPHKSIASIPGSHRAVIVGETHEINVEKQQIGI